MGIFAYSKLISTRMILLVIRPDLLNGNVENVGESYKLTRKIKMYETFDRVLCTRV